MGYDIDLVVLSQSGSPGRQGFNDFDDLWYFVVPPIERKPPPTSSDLNPQYNTCGINTANLTLLRILKYYNLPRYIDISLWLFLVLIHI